ncbi:MAG: ATP-binding cassette domain-containing protein [Bacillota bacterium]|nr:ATP-binding cassette domain-containing protein [Bacillota bacterium]
MVIVTEDLSKYFNDFAAVNGINIEVAEREIFGFLGPNGAGKTTTIKMLCTLMRPSEGRAEVAGYDISKNPFLVRKNIGLVFQEPTLDENLTAYENLYFHGMIYGLTGKKLRHRIEEVMALSSLWNRRDDLVKTFSGGMKRRLEISRGLIHFPVLLFLDEPTVGLDPQTRMHVWEYIKQMREELGVSVFMTTHYMDEAEHCDRISIIDQGDIIACDSPFNLKRSLKGELIKIHTSDKMNLGRLLEDKLGLNPQIMAEGIVLEVENAEAMLPRIVNFVDLSSVKQISFEKPTLDDVFIKFTGKAIREEEGSSQDFWKERVSMHRRSK